MFLLDRRTFLNLTAGTLAATAAGRAFAAPSEGQVYTSDASGGNVDSVIVMGDEKAALIDAQMTVPHASAVADMIAATGRDLETIIISHFHPDHVLGLAVLMDRFPDAKPVAHAKVQPGIEAAAAAMLSSMSADAPAGLFAERVVIPDALSGDHVMLEGERLEVLDPLHGDTDLISPVHIPALDILVMADLGFNETHVWTAENTTPERIEMWRASLTQLEGLGAGTVIPGHRSDSAANDASVFTWTRGYLDIWEQALTTSKSAEELKAAMLNGREDLDLGFAVERAVAAVFPQ